MNFMRHLLTFFLLLGAIFSFAQNECGTTLTLEQQEYIRNTFSKSRPSSIFNDVAGSAIVDIPLKIHVIRETDGSGGLTEGQVNAAVNTVNSYFQNSNMRFFVFEGINFIDNSDFFNLSASQEGAVAVPNDVSNTINVYFSATLSSSGTPLCGYTRFPPSSDRVFVANGCVFGGTFEHELGHYFTLYHTHGKTNTGTTDELVDGSNCTTAGDDLCDTPADPNLSGQVSASCAYTGGQKDANGDFFVPMVNNIMAYSLDQCQDAFTDGQYDRMRQGFENFRSYLNFSSTEFSAFFSSNYTEICPGSEVKFEAVSFGATSYEWSFEGGNPSSSTDESPVVTYNEPGVFNVTLIARDNGASEAVSEKIDFINVINPLENLADLEISSDIPETTLPNGWVAENPDNSLTFEISSIDIEENPNSNSIMMNNYQYNADVSGNVDYLILPTFVSTGIRGFNISFDYAYTYNPIFVNQVFDSLAVLVEVNCLDDELILWEKGGDELRTADPTTESFEPTVNEWEAFETVLELTSEFDYGKVKLRNISYKGNNLYIDNLSVIPDFNLYSPDDLEINKLGANWELTWDDNSINETGFIIQTSPDGEVFTNLDTTLVNIEEYVIQSTGGISESFYRVVALGVNNYVSEPSDAISLNPLSLDFDDGSSVKLWPNPASSIITIQSDKSIKCNYTLFNLSGKQIMSGSFDDSELSLNISNLNPGVFIIKLDVDNNIISKTFFKK